MPFPLCPTPTVPHPAQRWSDGRQGQRGNASAVFPTADFKRQQRTPLLHSPRTPPDARSNSWEPGGITAPPTAASLHLGPESPPHHVQASREPPAAALPPSPCPPGPEEGKAAEGSHLRGPGTAPCGGSGLRAAALAAAGFSRQPKPGRSSPQGAPMPGLPTRAGRQTPPCRPPARPALFSSSP